MRGKESYMLLSVCSSRITPAHAGKRPAAFILATNCGDHPRPCGEKPALSHGNVFHTGSPPPMRGKVNVEFVHDLRVRITPAHAGKSFLPASRASGTWDHPRPCGEKSLASVPNAMPIGSPPPMRGKDYAAYVFDHMAGITPAHAGKSGRRPAGRGKGRDHPRPCGEKAMANLKSFSARGSPPPMRGKVSSSG